MTSQKPAAAGQRSAAKSNPEPVVATGVKLIRLQMEPNKASHPAALYRGPEPKPGDLLEFTLDNRVTYQGTVAEATEADGEVLAEFTGPLKVISTK
ncbi:hypothetical protein PhaeoP83_01671 [Phaeobacter inhibens]|uniref:Uncharacterized protein n=1 Tax=Phaeobacter inhibens TaxID=221822 RepID=A0ABM6RDL1_9RHOB|nr:hypothetical protein [Phaeobacter inhibens]AUQ49945.1 hypothetical protein PhaeoP83_01671 [Phaeobacter inhibens]AUQ94501.1 hypothetical protein PhaeoP66_01719 [Phaeobacter inhibens]AUR19750.1 hypothetical protein PhaeoP80_01671 [Phaeobacter inhibens]